MSGIEQIVKRQVDRWNVEALAMKEAGEKSREKRGPKPFITLSKGWGTGVDEIARLLANELDWMILDKELADYVAGEAHVQRQILESVDRPFENRLENYFYALLQGQSPHTMDYARNLGRMLHVHLQHDPAIVIGRGSNILLRDLRKNGLNVRLVAPLSWRIAFLVEHGGRSEAVAQEEIRTHDAESAFYIKQAFGLDIADPNLYDLILNREEIRPGGIVEVILAAFRSKGLSR